MTIAARARAHWLWPDYLKHTAEGDVSAVRATSHAIAADLGLTEKQRLCNLPQIARQTRPRGRPSHKRSARCPYCAHELVIEV